MYCDCLRIFLRGHGTGLMGSVQHQRYDAETWVHFDRTALKRHEKVRDKVRPHSHFDDLFKPLDMLDLARARCERLLHVREQSI
jgi:hypothetical protein